jgi:hypothetical protein
MCDRKSQEFTVAKSSHVHERFGTEPGALEGESGSMGLITADCDALKLEEMQENRTLLSLRSARNS